MRKVGIFLRVLGAIMILVSMGAEVLLIETRNPALVQKVFFLSLVLGLFFYVLGMALMKGKSKNHLKPVPQDESKEQHS